MKKNKFDIHAKHLLGDHEEFINSEALWDDVQAELYPERKKRFAWIWFSASSILAVILFAGYIMYVGNTEETLDSTPENQIETNTETNNEITNKEINIGIAATPVFNTENSKPKSTNNARPKNTPKKPNKKSTIKTEDRVATKPIVGNSNSNNKIQIKGASPKKKKNTVSTFPITETKDSIFKNSYAESNSTLPKETAETNPQNVGFEDVEQEKALTEKGSVIEKEDEQNEEEDSNESISRKLNRKFSLGVGFRAGISNSLTTLTASDEEAIPLRALRNESETNLETIDIGLDILLKHKSGVYLSTGIDYLRAVRKLEYRFEEGAIDSIAGITSIIVHPITMDSTFVEGLVARTTITSRNKETFNNLHIINIPVQLGVNLRHEQWSFGIQGGALFNVLINRKGEIFDSENTFYDLDRDENNWFRDNLGVSFQGAALIGYNFSKNFQIVGGPSFRSPLTVSEAINPVKQSQTGIGLQVSVRYWLD